jgi:hypothetical protein
VWDFNKRNTVSLYGSLQTTQAPAQELTRSKGLLKSSRCYIGHPAAGCSRDPLLPMPCMATQRRVARHAQLPTQPTRIDTLALTGGTATVQGSEPEREPQRLHARRRRPASTATGWRWGATASTTQQQRLPRAVGEREAAPASVRGGGGRAHGGAGAAAGAGTGAGGSPACSGAQGDGGGGDGSCGVGS